MRLFQFRLWTLFIVITGIAVVVACFGRWYRLRQGATVAHNEQERIQAAFDAGLEAWQTPVEAYRNWCLAESKVPFSDRKAT